MSQAAAVPIPVDFLLHRIAELRGPLRVILFGSRARGDHHDRSDYDIALDAPAVSSADWARFALEVREHFPSLCGLDLVRLTATTAADLRQKIQQEGRVIYERT